MTATAWADASPWLAPASRPELPRWQLSGFSGFDFFGEHSELGNSWTPDQVPAPSVLVGARVAYALAPRLARHRLGDVALLSEGELKLAPAFTSTELGGSRRAYFAPVVGLRAHAMVAWQLPHVTPHVLAGVSAESVWTASPYMANDTDPMPYWGVGASIHLGELDRWRLRIDGRQGFAADRMGGVSPVYEVHLGVSTPLFWRKPQRRVASSLERCLAVAQRTAQHHDDDACFNLSTTPLVPATAIDLKDSDGDGIFDRSDKCPLEPGIAIATGSDTGPAFGCPETTAAAAPAPAPTTKQTALVVSLDGPTIEFAPGKSVLSGEAKRRLDGFAQTLRTAAPGKILITAGWHGAGGDRARKLALRRAEQAKWYLVDAHLRLPDSIMTGIISDDAARTLTREAPRAQQLELMYVSTGEPAASPQGVTPEIAAPAGAAAVPR